MQNIRSVNEFIADRDVRRPFVKRLRRSTPRFDDGLVRPEPMAFFIHHHR